MPPVPSVAAASATTSMPLIDAPQVGDDRVPVVGKTRAAVDDTNPRELVPAAAQDVLHAALGDVPAESEDAVLQAAPEPEVGEVEVGEERLLERAERTLEVSPQRFDR